MNLDDTPTLPYYHTTPTRGNNYTLDDKEEEDGE